VLLNQTWSRLNTVEYMRMNIASVDAAIMAKNRP
jgi:hypothetical protein